MLQPQSVLLFHDLPAPNARKPRYSLLAITVHPFIILTTSPSCAPHVSLLPNPPPSPPSPSSPPISVLNAISKMGYDETAGIPPFPFPFPSSPDLSLPAP